VRSMLRLVWAGWRFHVKSLTLSGFFLLTSAIQPVIFATIAFFMFKAGAREGTLLYVSLGAGLMGIWSATLFASGGAIQWQRWQGTLELSIASPAPFLLVLLPMTLASATIGLYSLTGTLLWGRLLFGVPFELDKPLIFLLAIPATVIGLGLLGLVMASTFILWRNANALSNLLEYPIWLVTGLLVPISLLPGWVAPLSWVLAPTWGVRAIRDAALGGGNPLAAVGMCLGLGALYLAVGALTVRHFEQLARDRATLSLT
jgi:ABC-2 type transport system permease protein